MLIWCERPPTCSPATTTVIARVPGREPRKVQRTDDLKATKDVIFSFGLQFGPLFCPKLLQPSVIASNFSKHCGYCESNWAKVHRVFSYHLPLKCIITLLMRVRPHVLYKYEVSLHLSMSWSRRLCFLLVW